MDRYTPKQKDIVWIDFEPSRGAEIKKRRPAIVVSRDEYNKATRYCIVCPVTSNKKRSNPTYFDLNDYKVRGQVATAQIYTLDYTENAGRNIEYKDIMRDEDFLQIAQMIQNNFGFNI